VESTSFSGARRRRKSVDGFLETFFSDMKQIDFEDFLDSILSSDGF